MAVSARVKAGGQALADGVLMRTDRAWAIARTDGSVTTGHLAANRVRIPVLRVILSLGAALRLGVARGMFGSGTTADRSSRARRANRRLMIALVAAEVGVVALGRVVPPGPMWFGVVMGLLPFAVVLAFVRVATPAALWRFHGAEHKAVAAHEAGVDLGDVDEVMKCSRVHNRCGTNLLSLLLVFSLLIVPAGAWAELPLFLIALGISAELVSLAAKRPGAWWSRAVLAPGRWVQRNVTTAEPTRDELVLGCRALEAALAEHAISLQAEAITLTGDLSIEPVA